MHLACGWIANSDRDVALIIPRIVVVFKKGNALAVGRPRERAIRSASFPEDFAGVLAIGLHQPDFLMFVIATDKGDLRTVRRYGAFPGVVYEFAWIATECR